MSDDGPDIGDFDSEAVISGLSDFAPQYPPFDQDELDWEQETVHDYGGEPGNEVWTRGGETQDDPFSPGISDCLNAAGPPPGSGTWVLGTVGGVCQWINTTVCS